MTTAIIDGHPEPTGRWVLHRAGIRNVWQYDDAHLQFAGGRLLLRGMNGAGKSKALELLLPFLLDGDTRRLDATGRDRTTVRWLMTDGRTDGHHIGYAWLELRLIDDTGDQSFLTLGAGLKASVATGRSEVWYFLTDFRVGIDLQLDVDRETMSLEKLKAAIGSDAVAESGAEHRRRVARVLFGLHDEARFSNLLHLLHQLRDPNIGNRVEEGSLAILLSDALPPLDDRFLADAAGRLDDLEQIKEQVDHAERAAATLADFLEVYSGYARTKLRERADTATAASKAGQRTRRRAGLAATALRDAEADEATAKRVLDERRAERGDADAARSAIERSDLYRSHQSLVDREATVAALGRAARSAAEAASQAESVVDQVRADLEAAATAQADDTASVREAFGVAADDLGRCGIDRLLLAPPPSMDDADADDQRAATVLAMIARRLDAVRAVRALSAVAGDRAATAASAADALADGEMALESATTVLASATDCAAAASDGWVESVRAWSASDDATRAALEWDRLEAAFDAEAEQLVAAVRDAIAATIEPVLVAARASEADAAAAATLASSALADAEGTLAAAEAETIARPTARLHHRADRDPARGAPFYELVDLRPGITSDDAAGVEAALDAAGILDAWVTPPGAVVARNTEDVILTVDGGARPADADLGSILRPAPGPDSPVEASVIAAILATIGVGGGAEAWVGTDGTWRLGVLHGAYTKTTVEFLGAGARTATRLRRIAAAEAALSDARRTHRESIARAAAALAARAALESLPSTVPDSAAIPAALADVEAAERTLTATRGRHVQLASAASAADAASARARAELEREAGRHELPTGLADLEVVADALRDADAAVHELGRSVVALRRSAAQHQRVEGAVNDAVERARGRHADAAERAVEHTAAATEVATLRAAIGADADALMADHQRHVDRVAALDRDEIPAAESAWATAIDHLGASRAELVSANERADEADALATSAGHALRLAAELPGVLDAAVGELALAITDDATELASQLSAVLTPSENVSDALVLARYDRLQQSLVGGYDAALDETNGIKVVHVADDRGRHPLATIAARAAGDADQARARLAERERDVLERFLLQELTDELRARLLDAEDLVAGANRALARVRTSHGKGVHLEWRLHDDAPPAAADVARLVIDELRGEDGDANLRASILALIEAERATDPTTGYEQHLRSALDYRRWHSFRVQVTDDARPGSRRLLSSKLGLSQGEQRVLSYLALFAAAAAQFDALRRDTPSAPRLLLLDDAFAKVDEPTHAQLLAHLAELDLDFVLTSERLWGCFPTVPSLEIYEAVRDPAVAGVALVHYRWDGNERHLVGV